MVATHKEATKGKKLGWEILKLQAQVGETDSRKAMKAVEAENKKKGIPTPKQKSSKRHQKKKKNGQQEDSSDEENEDSEDEEKQDEEEDEEVKEELSQAAKEAAEKLWKLKEIKISQKIYHAKKEIKKAFVKAKSFENQRLSKRLREAKKAVETKDETKDEDKPAHKRKQDLSPEDVAKFEHEIELLKKMDMDALSEHAFATKLAKHPILGSHGLMAPYVQSKNKKDKDAKEEASTESTTTPKEALILIIENRLTNAKTVKEHMAKLWDELEHIVTGKKVDHQELSKKRKARNESPSEEGVEEQQQHKKAKTAKDTKNKKAAKDEEESDNEDIGSDVEMASFSGSDDDEENDGYDSDGMPLPMNAGPASAASSMFIGSLNAGNGKKDKKDKKGKKDKNDWVDDKFDEIYGKIKKNRPGQRARREKAERKFGKEANHVKKALEEAQVREEKKAARKAKQEKFKAKDASSANSQRLPNRRTIGAGDGSASVHQPAPPKAKKIPAGPDLNDPTLHPSWIAKQSEKAAMAAALSGAKSSKIVFDDSD